MTIEEKMEHFRMISLESANNQSAESLSSYKKSLDDDLEVYKDNSKRLAEESKRARINQVKSDYKKQLASSQMAIKKEKDLTKKQSEIKVKVFDIVRKKIADYRTTPEYIANIKHQIQSVLDEYGDSELTVYIDSNDSALLDELKSDFNCNIQVYDKDFLGGTRSIIPDKNILIDYSFKTKLMEEQEKFAITL